MWCDVACVCAECVEEMRRMLAGLKVDVMRDVEEWFAESKQHAAEELDKLQRVVSSLKELVDDAAMGGEGEDSAAPAPPLRSLSPPVASTPDDEEEEAKTEALPSPPTLTLLKRASKWPHRWHERAVTLHSSGLAWHHKEVMHGWVVVFSVSRVDALDGHSFVLRVDCDAAGSRHILFATDSEEHANAWVETLQSLSVRRREEEDESRVPDTAEALHTTSAGGHRGGKAVDMGGESAREGIDGATASASHTGSEAASTLSGVPLPSVGDALSAVGGAVPVLGPVLKGLGAVAGSKARVAELRVHCDELAATATDLDDFLSEASQKGEDVSHARSVVHETLSFVATVNKQGLLRKGLTVGALERRFGVHQQRLLHHALKSLFDTVVSKKK